MGGDLQWRQAAHASNVAAPKPSCFATVLAGLGGALSLLKDRGELNKKVDWVGRTSDLRSDKLALLDDVSCPSLTSDSCCDAVAAKAQGIRLPDQQSAELSEQEGRLSSALCRSTAAATCALTSSRCWMT